MLALAAYSSGSSTPYTDGSMPYGGLHYFVLLENPGLLSDCKWLSPATKLVESKIGYYCSPTRVYNIAIATLYDGTTSTSFVQRTSYCVAQHLQHQYYKYIRMACLALCASMHLVTMRAPQRVGVIHGGIVARRCVDPNASLGGVGLLQPHLIKPGWKRKPDLSFLLSFQNIQQLDTVSILVLSAMAWLHLPVIAILFIALVLQDISSLSIG